MKNYKIFFATYPFNMEGLQPESETIEAESLDKAFDKLEEMKGKGKIEIFKDPARKYYNE